MATPTRPMRGADVVSALSDPGTKIPTAALDVGTGPGQVAPGAATAAAAAAAAQARADAAAAATKADAAAGRAMAAQTDAATAASTAATAGTKAADALSKAVSANTAASAASTAAGGAVDQATSAAAQAEAAASAATAALSRANTAASNAATALTRANAASTDASAASTTASDAAVKAADAAGKVATAISAATSAKDAATKASSDVAGAVSNAQAATSAAAAAKTAADAATAAISTTKASVDQAVANAQTAKDAALKASQDVAGASTAASLATAAANSAGKAATDASAAAKAAQTSADAAATGLSGANTKADQAVATATAANAAAVKATGDVAAASVAAATATSAATGATTAAKNAQAAADTATSSLSAISTKADAASTAATSAATKAAAAQTAATAAQAAAAAASASISGISTKADAATARADGAVSAAGTADAKATAATSSIAGLNDRLGAATKLTADGTGLLVTFNGKTYVIPVAGGIVVAPALPLASAGYRMPGTLFSIDPALVAGTAALVAGTPGIQLNANGDGDVQAMNEAISAIPITHGAYGQIALKPASGVRPFPFFDQSAHSLSWDSAILPPTTGTPMFGPVGASWWVTFLFTQTGTAGGQLMKVQSPLQNPSDPNSAINIYISITASGCLYVEQNNGAAYGTEPANSRAAIGRRSYISVFGNGVTGTISIFREGTKTFETPAGTIAGFNGPPAVFEFLNNPQGMCELIEGGAGNPSIAAHTAYLADKGTRYNMAVGVVSEGSAAGIAPATVDTTLQFNSLPNFPISDTPPVIQGRALGGGLTLSAGATNLANYVFGTAAPDANVRTGQAVRDLFYTHYFPGNPMDGGVLNAPCDTGHPASDPKFWAVARTYPVGHPNDVHRIGPNGLDLLAYGNKNNSEWAMRKVFAGLIRSPLPILPGMTLRMRWKKPGGRFSWAPWWLSSGDEFTKGPNCKTADAFWANFSPDFTRPTNSFRREAQSTNFHELDCDDNFDRTPDGSPPGFSVDFIPVWDIYNTPYTTTPGLVWAKETGAYSYPAGHTRTTFDQSAGFYDEIVSWRGVDGVPSAGNFIDQYMGPAGGPYTLIKTVQMEYHPNTYITMDGATHIMGMNLVVANTCCPTFAGGYPNVTNTVEGNALTNSTFPTIAAIDIWKGVVTNPVRT